MDPESRHRRVGNFSRVNLCQLVNQPPHAGHTAEMQVSRTSEERVEGVSCLGKKIDMLVSALRPWFTVGS